MHPLALSVACHRQVVFANRYENLGAARGGHGGLPLQTHSKKRCLLVFQHTEATNRFVRPHQLHQIRCATWRRVWRGRVWQVIRLCTVHALSDINSSHQTCCTRSSLQCIYNVQEGPANALLHQPGAWSWQPCISWRFCLIVLLVWQHREHISRPNPHVSRFAGHDVGLLEEVEAMVDLADKAWIRVREFQPENTFSILSRSPPDGPGAWRLGVTHGDHHLLHPKPRKSHTNYGGC